MTEERKNKRLGKRDPLVENRDRNHFAASAATLQVHMPGCRSIKSSPLFNFEILFATSGSTVTR